MSDDQKKRMLLFAVAVAVLGIAAFTVMAVKDRTYVPSAAYSPVGESNRKVAVVYYSRSGHSEAVAREVARTFKRADRSDRRRLPPGLRGPGQGRLGCEGGDASDASGP